jgi:hypothetical protein
MSRMLTLSEHLATSITVMLLASLSAVNLIRLALYKPSSTKEIPR